MVRIIWFTLILSIVLSAPVLAARQNGGLAVSYATPKGAFKSAAADGWGASAIFDYPMAGVVNLSGSLGWYRFSGIKTDSGILPELAAGPSYTLWEFTAGPQADFGMLYLGVEAGYYTKFKEWGLVSNVGIRKNMIDVGLRYKMTEDAKFMAVRLGFFF